MGFLKSILPVKTPIKTPIKTLIAHTSPFAGSISSAKIKANNDAKTGSNENIRPVKQ
jgi:hypothetical protein